MTSIILVHAFVPHPDEHYTALPAEEGQPVSYVRRVVLEASAPADVMDVARRFLREGESVANMYAMPNSGSEQMAPTSEANDLTGINDALAKRRPKSKP